MHTLSTESLRGIVGRLRRDPCIAHVASTSRQMNAAYHDGHRRRRVRLGDRAIEWPYGVLPHRTCEAAFDCAPAVALSALRRLAVEARRSSSGVVLSCPSAESNVTLGLLQNIIGIDAVHVELHQAVALSDVDSSLWRETTKAEALGVMSRLAELRHLTALSVDLIDERQWQGVAGALGRAMTKMPRLTALALSARSVASVGRLQLPRLGALRRLDVDLWVPDTDRLAREWLGVSIQRWLDAWMPSTPPPADASAAAVAPSTAELNAAATAIGARVPPADELSATWFRDLADAVAGMPQLEVLKLKIVCDSSIGVAAAAPVYGAVARLKSLRLLDLGGNWVSNSGLVVALGGADDGGGVPRLTGLRLARVRPYATLSGTPHEFAAALAALGRHAAHLEDIDLTGWAMPCRLDPSPRVTDALSWNAASRVRRLRIAHCALGGVLCNWHPSRLPQLSQALRGAPALEVLDLEENQLATDPAGFAELMRVIGSLGRLTELDLSSNALGAVPECLGALGANLGRMVALRSLRLNACHLASDLKCLRVLPPTLVRLDLRSNRISSFVYIVFSPLPALVELDLGHNLLGKSGSHEGQPMAELVGAPQMPALRILKLDGNPIHGDYGELTILGGLARTRLVNLGLPSRLLTDHFRHELTERLGELGGVAVPWRQLADGFHHKNKH